MKRKGQCSIKSNGVSVKAYTFYAYVFSLLLSSICLFATNVYSLQSPSSSTSLAASYSSGLLYDRQYNRSKGTKNKASTLINNKNINNQNNLLKRVEGFLLNPRISNPIYYASTPPKYVSKFQFHFPDENFNGNSNGGRRTFNIIQSIRRRNYFSKNLLSMHMSFGGNGYNDGSNHVNSFHSMSSLRQPIISRQPGFRSDRGLRKGKNLMAKALHNDGIFQYGGPGDVGGNDISTWSLAATASAYGGSAAAAVALKKKKKVLILMSDTGGGHRASAQALESALNELYPGQIKCDIVDIWTDYAPYPFNTFVSSYQFMAKNPIYWKLFWEYGRFPLTKWGTEQTTNLLCHQRFKNAIVEKKPDIIISVHPLCQDIPLRILKNLRKENGLTNQSGSVSGSSATTALLPSTLPSIASLTKKGPNVLEQEKNSEDTKIDWENLPFVTVVTDLGGAHPTWFHKEVDYCFVPSNPVKKIALSMGLKQDQIRQHGLPIRPGFWKEISSQKADATQERTKMRSKLDMKNAKTALIVGGGDGIGNIEEITLSLAQEMAKRVDESQIVVICGKNEVIKNNLLRAKFPENVNVVVKGFVTNMDEYMTSSDCIITKAGPGTIAEATTRGLPCMLFNFLPGQEAGNVDFVIDNGFGSYSKNPSTIADTVTSWLEDDEILATLSNKAKEAACSASTITIASEIGMMLFNKSRRLPKSYVERASNEKEISIVQKENSVC